MCHGLWAEGNGPGQPPQNMSKDVDDHGDFNSKKQEF